MRAEYGNAHSFRRWLVGAALVVLSLSAGAGSLTRTNVGGFEVRGSGNTWTFGDAKPRPGDIPWETMTGPTNVDGAWELVDDGAGGPAAKSKARLPIPDGGGRSVPVDVTAKVPKSSAAAAIGRFAMKVSTPLAVGNALYDLAKELGFSMKNKPDGSAGALIEKEGYVDKWRMGSGLENYPSADALCQAWASTAAPYRNYGISNLHVEPGTAEDNAYCAYSITAYPQWGPQRYQMWRSAHDVALTPVQEQEFVEAIGAQSGWPTSASRALAESLRQGEGVTHLVPSVAGPASVPGAKATRQETVTKPGPDGSTVSGVKTTTTNTTYNTTYNNNTITINQQNTTSFEINWSDGTTEEGGEATETTEPEKEPSECETNPDLVTCQKLDVPDEEVPKSTKNVSFSTEDMGWGGGSCPAPFTWSDSLGSHSINLAPMCAKMTEVVRPVVLLLAALMALAIAMPGIKE